MRLTIDTDRREVVFEEDGRTESVPLYSRRAFELISRQWVRVGWNEKYPYTFSWLGRPIIQLPEDLLRIQEAITEIRPDVVVETGVAHGGSLVFYASILQALGGGRVVGVDIEIRPANRKAIESHVLAPLITLIEGNSVDPAVVNEVHAGIAPQEKVLVLLDSNHTKAHVAAELEAYASLVTAGSYIVATDGVMEDLHDVPRGKESWRDDNPSSAAREFAARHPEFVLEPPRWPFNESALQQNVTHWPDAWLRRVR
ncbi:MAG: CmcI family methyltransferase [Acidobacteriota bacterium]